MNAKSVPTYIHPEPEWLLTDLRNLGEAIGIGMIKKYSLVTQIEALEGRMTSEDLATQGTKLVKMSAELDKEVIELAKKLQTLKDANPA